MLDDPGDLLRPGGDGGHAAAIDAVGVFARDVDHLAQQPLGERGGIEAEREELVIDAEAAKIIAATRSDWMLICPEKPEITNLAEKYPASLAATLVAGRAPEWLEPVALPQGSAASPK